MYTLNKLLINQYILPYNAPNWEIFTVLGVCTVISIVVAYLCIKFKRCSLYLVGILFGLMVGLVLYSTFIYRFSSGKSWLLITVLVVCGIGFGVLSYLLNMTGFIIYTSFIGSYLVVRATSWYIGGYPNEWTLYEQLKTITFAGNWKFYIYLLAMLVLTAGGIIVQCVLFKRNSENPETLEALINQKESILNYFNQKKNNKAKDNL